MLKAQGDAFAPPPQDAPVMLQPLKLCEPSHADAVTEMASPAL